MSQVIGNGIRHAGIHQEDAHFPWNLAAAVTEADKHKPMAIDTGANHTLKVAGDGERIIGPLRTFEDRIAEGIKVGTVEHHGGFKFEYDGALAVGDSIVGSAVDGKVKKAAAARADNVVTAVDTLGAGTCEVVFL